MNNLGLGKKLYKSSTLRSIKIFLVCVAAILFAGLINNTFTDPEFVSKKISVLKFHFMYPEQVISFIFMALIPSIYYGFIRGITFYEKAIVINRGVPFWNHVIYYKEIEFYRIMKSKYLMSITKRNKQELVFTISDADRAVAIMDQNGIPARFVKDNIINEVSSHKRLLVGITISGIVIYLIQHFGVVSKLFR